MRSDELIRGVVIATAATIACGSQGGPQGESATDSQGETDTSFTLDVPGFLIDPKATNDLAVGKPVGDVNGDGLGDIAVTTTTGRAYVVFGKAESKRVKLAEFGADEGAVFAVTTGVRSIVAAGDVNGDGLDDLLLSTEGDADHLPLAYVVFGQGNLGSLNLDALDPADGRLLYESPWLGRFQVLGVGDISGDGFDDVAIIEGICCRLEIRLLYGDDDLHEVTEADLMAGSRGVALGRSYLTEVHAAGDVNGDGFADLLVEQIDDYHTNYGTVHVIFGGAPLAPLDLDNGPPVFDGFTIKDDTAYEFDIAGGADVNGDGLADVILSEYSGNEIYVVFGKPDDETVQLPGDISGGAGLRIEPRPDVPPYSKQRPLIIPDRDGDGLADVALVANLDDYGDLPEDQVELIHRLDGGGPITTDDPRRLLLNDWSAGEHLGRFGGWGAIDGMGGPDLVVSRHGGSLHFSAPAQIFVYFDPEPD